MAQKRMLVLCPFPVGVAAGQRLKYEQYFDRWRNQGWEIDVSPFMDKNMWNVIYKKGYFINKVHGTIRGHFRRIFDLFRVPRAMMHAKVDIMNKKKGIDNIECKLCSKKILLYP